MVPDYAFCLVYVTVERYSISYQVSLMNSSYNVCIDLSPPLMILLSFSLFGSSLSFYAPSYPVILLLLLSLCFEVLGMESNMLRGEGGDKVVRVVKAILQSDLHFILALSILLGRFL